MKCVSCRINEVAIEDQDRCTDCLEEEARAREELYEFAGLMPGVDI